MSAPCVLLILDGWGKAAPGPGNAVSLARTPNMDRLFRECPHGELKCMGRDVGLPDVTAAFLKPIWNCFSKSSESIRWLYTD